MSDVHRHARLSAGARSVGLTSFFSDSGHEITTAVLPSFITTVLHSTAAALGVIEGLSDALTGLASVVGGPLANDKARRGRLATSGYLGTAAATGAIGAAAAVWQVGVLRALAWASRGLRSPARDTLLADLAPTGAVGRAYGFERAGDNLGAVVGPLLAAGLVGWVGVRPTLYLAAVPGVLAAVAITVAAREARRAGRPATSTRLRLELATLRDAGISRRLVPVACFECGNLATTLLILRAGQLLSGHGRSATAATSLAIVIYAAHNAVGAGVSLVAGRWADRSGPRVVLLVGAGCYVLAYLGFASPESAVWWLVVAFVLAGAGIGCAETAESTIVAGSLPDAARGSGFAVLGGIKAAGDIVATLVAGVLYTAVSPTAAFSYAAAWMLASVLASTLTPGRR